MSTKIEARTELVLRCSKCLRELEPTNLYHGILYITNDYELVLNKGVYPRTWVRPTTVPKQQEVFCGDCVQTIVSWLKAG